MSETHQRARLTTILKSSNSTWVVIRERHQIKEVIQMTKHRICTTLTKAFTTLRWRTSINSCRAILATSIHIHNRWVSCRNIINNNNRHRSSLLIQIRAKEVMLDTIQLREKEMEFTKLTRKSLRDSSTSTRATLTLNSRNLTIRGWDTWLIKVADIDPIL